MNEEPKDPIEAYDAAHGDPSKTPAAPALSEADEWGTKLNPVRDTPLAGTGLKQVGK
jgi:hypothetical protein